MKKFILSLLLLPVMAMATITAEEEFALNRLSGVARKYSLGTHLAKKPSLVVGKYSFAVQGGATGDISLLRDLNDTASTITIPDNAIVKQVWTDNLIVGAGGSLAFTLQTAADLVAAKNSSLFTAGAVQAGTPVGTAATMIKLTADRVPKATISGSALTQGKINVYIEYVLGD
jgi:hypothetical protein